MSIEGGSNHSDANPQFEPIGSYEDLMGFIADIGEARLNLSDEGFALVMRAYWQNVVDWCGANNMTFEAELFSRGLNEADDELRRAREGELPNIPPPEPLQPLN